MYGVRVLRCAPWKVLLGGTGLAVILFVIATLTATTSLCWPTCLLGLSTCGATAAYVLDEEAASIADATPASRSRRTCWRLCIVALPAVVATTALARLNSLDPSTHWLRLLPLAAGSIVTGVAVAAALRRAGSATPGDLAGAIALATTVVFVMTDPVRRWVSVAALGDRDAAGVMRSQLLWAGVILAGCGVVLVCSRDPGRGRYVGRQPTPGSGVVRQSGPQVDELAAVRTEPLDVHEVAREPLLVEQTRVDRHDDAR